MTTDAALPEDHPAAALMPPMSAEEYTALVEDIRVNGQIEPITLVEDLILDGRHRYRACLQLGIRPKVRQWVKGFDPDPVAFVLSQNLHRRHLSPEMRRHIIAGRVLEEPQRSDRSLARELGVSHVTVGAVREELEESGQIDHLDRRLDPRTGRLSQPASRSANDDLRRQFAYEVPSLEPPAPALEPAPPAPHQILTSSQSNEWYTPQRYIDAVREVLGSIDLDPASCALANETVQATRYFSEVDDGLSQRWVGRVFLNPPYGRTGDESNQALWSGRLIDLYQLGEVEAAILLVNAVPAERWFRPLWEFPICFTDHRIRFYNADGEASSPTHSNAFVYLGPDLRRFVEVFSAIGVVARRVNQEEEP